MRSKTIIAGILIVFGIVVLVYSGVTYKTRGKPGRDRPTAYRDHKKPLYSPVAGAVALVGGIVLLVLDTRKV